MRQAGDVTYADAHKTRKNEGVVEFACKNVSIRIKIGQEEWISML